MDRSYAYKHPDGRTTDQAPDGCGQQAAKLLVFFILTAAVLADLAIKLIA